MPEEVGAVTVVDTDGDYNVYLNAKRSDLEKELAHEMKHIKDNDFYNDMPIELAEWRAG